MGSCFHRPPGRALGGRMIGTPLQISRKKFTKIAKSGPAGSFLWIEGENLTQHRDRAGPDAAVGRRPTRSAACFSGGSGV